jgi:hypothetical protein
MTALNKEQKEKQKQKRLNTRQLNMLFIRKDEAALEFFTEIQALVNKFASQIYGKGLRKLVNKAWRQNSKTHFKYFGETKLSCRVNHAKVSITLASDNDYITFVTSSDKLAISDINASLATVEKMVTETITHWQSAPAANEFQSQE